MPPMVYMYALFFFIKKSIPIHGATRACTRGEHHPPFYSAAVREDHATLVSGSDARGPLLRYSALVHGAAACEHHLLSGIYRAPALNTITARGSLWARACTS